MIKLILVLINISWIIESNVFGDNVSDRTAYSESMHAYIATLRNSGLTPEREKALVDLADKDSRLALTAIQRPTFFAITKF